MHRNTRGQRLDFRWHPWQKHILQDPARETVIMSSVQSGKSERNIVKMMAHLALGHNVLYVLPTIELRNRFVAARINPLWQEVAAYRVLLDVAAKRFTHGREAADAAGLKHIGNGTVAFVGSNAPPSLREFVADVVIVDELDQCDAENVVRARDRVAHSAIRAYHLISNPTIHGFGIDTEYARSTQYRWHLKCSSCRHWQQPTWWDNVVIETDEGEYDLRCVRGDAKARTAVQGTPDSPPYLGAEDLWLVCQKCNRPLDRFADGKWVAAYPNRDIVGWHVSQLFAGTVTLREMYREFERALRSETERMRFYNSVLGEPYESEGAKMTPVLLQRCVRDYAQQASGKRCIMGVDVGAVLHVVIIEGKRIVRITIIPGVDGFDQLANLMRLYDVQLCVIDADPETRQARMFADKFPKRVLLCRFPANQKIDYFQTDYKAATIVADRTQAFDESHARICEQSVELPRDSMSVADFAAQMCAPTRIFRKRGETDPGRFVWYEGSQADHYRLAYLYAVLGLDARSRHGVSFFQAIGSGVSVG